METNRKLKTYTKGEFAALYGVQWRTLRKWIKRISRDIDLKSRRRILTPNEIEKIIGIIGEP